MVGIVIAGFLAAAAAFISVVFFYRWLRRRFLRQRIISIVALTREPVSFDPAILATVAGKAWNADLGDGQSEGTDGFVAAPEGPTTMIRHGQRTFLVHAFPIPYTKDTDRVAEQIPDLRVATLFREHRAWFSCDSLDVDGSSPEADVREAYQRLGTLFSEFLDEKCLLIYLPELERAYPVNEDTIAAVRSLDPVAALRETSNPPIIEISDDDPRLVRAVEQARTEWPKFVAAFEERAGEQFSIKAPLSHEDHTEFIWIAVTGLEGDRVYGEIANEPGNLGPLKLGSKVCVPLSDLNDWCYMDPQNNLAGGFTIKALRQAQQRKRAR